MTARALATVILATIGAAGCASPDTPPAEPTDTTDMSERSVDPTNVRPFQVSVPDSVLADLDERLGRTRFPDQVGSDWAYGADLDYMRELAAYWRDEYDWRERERQLNAFDHYKTEIDGLDIHFIHEPSPHPDALPLLVLHGWPGSVVEFLEIIGPLSDPDAHGGDHGSDRPQHRLDDLRQELVGPSDGMVVRNPAEDHDVRQHDPRDEDEGDEVDDRPDDAHVSESSRTGRVPRVAPAPRCRSSRRSVSRGSRLVPSSPSCRRGHR